MTDTPKRRRPVRPNHRHRHVMTTERRARQVRLDPDVDARLEEAAAERMVSASWLVNRLVRDGLERLVPVDELRLTRPPGGQP